MNRVHLTKTGDAKYPYGILKLCANGAFGWIVYGDTRENCIKIAHSQGYKVFDNQQQKEVQS